MKSLKAQFIGAIAMVLVAAIAMGSSTYAWFAMNTTVSATNMKVKAVAEDGIVIADAAKSAWSSSADGIVTSGLLVPTSTPSLASPTWVHASSPSTTNANAGVALGGEYQDLSPLFSNTTYNIGVGYINNDGVSGYDSSGSDKAYFLKNTFFIKASGGNITGTPLYLNDLTVTSSAEGGTFNKLDNALRVLVVVGGTPFLFAPVKDQASGTTTLSYTWKGTTAVTPRYPGGTSTLAVEDIATGVTEISNQDGSAVQVDVYMFFEGEDNNCRSEYISGLTMNDLSLTVRFGTTQLHTV